MGRFLTNGSGGMWVASSETGGKNLFSEEVKGLLGFWNVNFVILVEIQVDITGLKWDLGIRSLVEWAYLKIAFVNWKDICGNKRILNRYLQWSSV